LFNRHHCCRLTGAGLRISQKAFPPIDANGLHGISKLAGGGAQLSVALAHIGALGGAAEFCNDRVISRAAEEFLGKTCFVEFGALDPSGHEFGQP